MTVGKLISIVDDERPNQYGKDQKTQWLSEIEGTIIDDILNQAEGNDIKFENYKYDRDAEKELQIPERFLDIYRYYLFSMIDFQNGESDRYNNDVAMYSAAMDSYAAYYRRTHRQKKARGYYNF